MKGPFVVFLMSLLPIPLSLILNTQTWILNQGIVLLAGVVALALVIVIPYTFIRRMRKPDTILYVMSLFMFSSVTDLIIALESDGILSEFMTFYLREGEPYLWTAYGTMINYWDGLVHYGLCIWILYRISNGKNYSKVGLYWAGSIINSLLVLVPGSVLGKFGVKWAILLNIPYLFVPVWIAFRLLKSREATHLIPDRQPMKTCSIFHRPMDILFLIYFLTAACVDLLRGFIAAGGREPLLQEYLEDHEPYIMDPVAYPKVQMILYMVYFVPFYACAIYGLINPAGQTWLENWALLYAGAAAQGQWSHIGASFHHRTAPEFNVPSKPHSQQVFWILNVGLFVVPQIFALYQNMYIRKEIKMDNKKRQ